jgi:hypothetical protein
MRKERMVGITRLPDTVFWAEPTRLLGLTARDSLPF